MTILYYVHDPMCSWCWAFVPTWKKIRQQLPDTIIIKYLLGGLAADSEEPMPLTMQHQIATYWHTIEEKVPGTRFNHDFWIKCKPRRSTYPACRAVIAARKQDPKAQTHMISAIQQAYYLDAKNPSDSNTLITLAADLGLHSENFKADLNSLDTQKSLVQEIEFAKKIGARGFPSLILAKNRHYSHIPLDYNDERVMLAYINTML